MCLGTLRHDMQMEEVAPSPALRGERQTRQSRVVSASTSVVINKDMAAFSHNSQPVTFETHIAPLRTHGARSCEPVSREATRKQM